MYMRVANNIHSIAASNVYVETVGKLTESIK